MDFDAIDSDVAASSRIYTGARVRSSRLADHTVVGNFSRVDASTLAERVRIDRNNQVFRSEMGRFSYTGMNTVVMQAEVGAFCSCAWNVTIGGANHDVSRVTQHAFLYNPYDGIRPEGHPAPYDRFAGKITIGHDVWIGAGAAIMRGVSVGNGAVIAANAVVTRDVPPYAIVAGNPARILRSRFPDAIVDRLQALQWWHWDVADLQAKYDLISAEPTPEVLDQLETG